MLKFEGSYHGLVFAKEWNELHEGGDTLGQSLQMNNVGEREFTATPLLQAGTPMHVIAERLGHSKITTTLQTYAHVLPDMQKDAATPLGTALYKGA